LFTLNPIIILGYRLYNMSPWGRYIISHWGDGLRWSQMCLGYYHGSIPAPIDMSATWRKIGGNINRLNKYCNMAALI
jgi:hypothetical protein